MKTKRLILTALTVGAFSGSLLAAGHDGEQHNPVVKEKHAGHAHADKKGAHSKGHQHDSGTSPVGKPAAPAQATRTIQVTTKDTMRYEFSTTPDLKAGDVVKFVITNEGKIAHEFSIGDEQEQQAHRQMMRKMPNMVHEDGNTVTIQPGQTKTLTWQFKGGSEAVFACNIPGHFEAGMVARTVVAASKDDVKPR
jgi:uncharacterized cupredoxin-like copper-binding protein